MKTITVPCLLQFDAIGTASAAEQTALVRELVNGALSDAGFNCEPAILPASSDEATDCLATLIQTIADIDGKMLNELMTPEFRARCEAITGPIKASPHRR